MRFRFLGFLWRLCLWGICLAAWAGDSALGGDAAWPIYTLRADAWWLLNLPNGERLDASGLVRFPDGELWTVNDQKAGVFRLVFREGTNGVDLVRVPGLFTPQQMAQLSAGARLRLDCEGLARDSAGRVYVCEESQRKVFRWDPGTKEIETLRIDWLPVKHFFNPTDLNASFEGVAVAGNRMYVANERSEGRIIVVDLERLEVVDHFVVRPAGGKARDTAYSDLCAWDGALWVLLRNDRKLLKVDPVRKQVLAEFDYAAMERARETGYGVIYAPGFMEGVAVDDQFIWLLTDNNDIGRRASLGDKRPTLFRCHRPDR